MSSVGHWRCLHRLFAQKPSEYAGRSRTMRLNKIPNNKQTKCRSQIAKVGSATCANCYSVRSSSAADTAHSHLSFQLRFICWAINLSRPLAGSALSLGQERAPPPQHRPVKPLTSHSCIVTETHSCCMDAPIPHCQNMASTQRSLVAASYLGTLPRPPQRDAACTIVVAFDTNHSWALLFVCTCWVPAYIVIGAWPAH